MSKLAQICLCDKVAEYLDRTGKKKSKYINTLILADMASKGIVDGSSCFHKRCEIDYSGPKRKVKCLDCGEILEV
jgi:hypothetical protein